jgi:hypothetical protein
VALDDEFFVTHGHIDQLQLGSHKSE